MQTVTIRKIQILRHLAFMLIIAAAVTAFFAARAVVLPSADINVYFADAEMMRLIPVRTSVPRTGAERTARFVLDAMIEGHDDNPKIFRLVPNVKNCMSVTVKDKIAYVDLKSGLRGEYPDGRDAEIMMVYSIVNSLTNIDGIVNVRFTVDGERQKDFLGFVDMRETFIPDYCV